MLLKARIAREAGFHSLWVGPGYLQNGWHPTVLLARVAAEAPGLEVGLVGILPSFVPLWSGSTATRAALGHNRLLPETDRIDVPFEQMLAGRFPLGSPAECIAEVARYRAVGVQELILRCQWLGMAVEPALQAMQRFGRDVLPQYAA